MLLRHFQLREQPFGPTPDPRFLFHTPTHREALAALLYGIESGLGFIALTANPGMGKTTILFEALSRLGKNTRTVFLFQAIQSPAELLRALLIDLGEKEPQGSLVDMQTRLNEILAGQAEAGKRLVVVLDEAQNLDYSVLEAVRMLSNFETASRKLMHIVLSGQLQLADRLAEPALLQLRQRISIFASLKPLSLADTFDYIHHRLRVAGYQRPIPLFSHDAVALIHRESDGIPRNINTICFNALSIGCAIGKDVIDDEVVREVMGDLDLERVKATEPFTVREAETDEADFVRPSERSTFDSGSGWSGLRVGAIAAILLGAAFLGGRAYLSSLPKVHSAAQAAPTAPAVQTPTPSPASAPNAGSDDPPPQAAPDTNLPEDASPAAKTASVSGASDPPASDPPASGEPASGRPDADSSAAPVSAQAALSGTSAATTRPGRHKRRTPARRFSQAGRPRTAVMLVRARDGQSFSSICVEHFGGCSPELLNTIMQLNPNIADPDHIRSGQRVILPVVATRPEVSNRPPSGD